MKRLFADPSRKYSRRSSIRRSRVTFGTVKAIDANRRILIEWNEPENPSEVEWTFEPRDGDRTWVTVENRDFSGTPAAQMKEALNSTQGFTFLLGGAKIWLEHGIEPRFVLDHNPDGLLKGWRDR